MAPIKMPTQSGATKTSGSSADDTKIRLEEMKSDSMKVQGAFDIAKESLRVANSFLEVIKSNRQLQAKREEWEHRVAEAQKSVEKAEIELMKEKEVTEHHRIGADLYLQTLRPLVEIFDDIMKDISDPALDPQTRNELREKLLKWGELIVRAEVKVNL